MVSANPSYAKWLSLLEGPPCPRLPHDSTIANTMKQVQMTTLIKIKYMQRQCIIALQSGVHSKLVVPVVI